MLDQMKPAEDSDDRPTNPFRAGQAFYFEGLPGEPDEGRHITIDSISVTGNLNIRIRFGDKGTRGFYNVPLTEALKMVELGIWGKAENPS